MYDFGLLVVPFKNVGADLRMATLKLVIRRFADVM